MYCQSPFYLRGDENGRNNTRYSDLGELDQHFHQDPSIDLTTSFMYDMKMSNVGVVSNNNLHFGGLTTASVGSSEIASVGSLGGENRNRNTNTGPFKFPKGVGNNGNISSRKRSSITMVEEKEEAQQGGVVGVFGDGNGNFENWADSGLADYSQQQQTETTSTDVIDNEKFQSPKVGHGPLLVDSIQRSNGGHQATRRLAQNREAARKSRLRKKAYIQQLEHSRLKLSQLEQELQRARQQGIFVASGISGDQCHSISSSGTLNAAFDMEYRRWVEEHQQLNSEVRLAVNSSGERELGLLVDRVMSHYDEMFKLKAIGAKADVFHLLSGMWKTPAERCFMWLGGFRSSEILKVVDSVMSSSHEDEAGLLVLTDEQLVGLCNLQQSSQQAEDALSQGMEALQHSLLETLSSNICLGGGGANVADYMTHMALAMAKLTTLENFLHQADLLRQQTLQQLHRILTTRQAARALLAISDYMSRLRALSSLWLARPKH